AADEGGGGEETHGARAGKAAEIFCETGNRHLGHDAGRSDQRAFGAGGAGGTGGDGEYGGGRKRRGAGEFDIGNGERRFETYGMDKIQERGGDRADGVAGGGNDDGGSGETFGVGVIVGGRRVHSSQRPGLFEPGAEDGYRAAEQICGRRRLGAGLAEWPDHAAERGFRVIADGGVWMESGEDGAAGRFADGTI